MKVYSIPNTNIVLEVSKDGKTIKTQDRLVTQKSSKGTKYTRTIKGQLLTPCDNGTGYLQIKVSYKSKTLHIYLHRLVWLAYKGDIPEGYEIDHKDDDKSNCDLLNLQLLTRKQNMDKCHKANPTLINNLINQSL